MCTGGAAVLGAVALWPSPNVGANAPISNSVAATTRRVSGKFSSVMTAL
jgi:hypothetical protein